MIFLLALLQAAGVVTPALERHVSDTGDDADDGSEKTPYRTIAHALDDANGLALGGRLVIKLKGTLSEPTLTLPSHVTLAGPAELVSTAVGPAVKIAAATTDVELRDLKIQGKGPYTGHGGAVLVESADKALLERCELHHSGAGRGGGLAILTSTGVKVRACQVHDNAARTTDTLAGARITPTVQVPTGDGHGGGIYLRDSDVELSGCDIFENEAILFGGGIAVSNAMRTDARVEVIDCQVTSNQVSHPPLGALAAPMTIKRVDIGDPVREAYRDALVPEEDEAKVVALLHGLNFESGLGGGIAIRSVTNTTRIAKCHIGVTRAGKEGANRARRGGGISCYIGAYPVIEENRIANNVSGGDGGGIAIDQFDPVLPPGTTDAYGVSAMAFIPRRPIAVTRNEIHDNHALEDGGGLYASGAAQVVVKGGFVDRNRSAEDGGGLRATYASNLYVEGVKIRDNQCNVVGSESDGGGGVAARNASVHLQDCELTGNLARGFAGGAVYFVSCWEGGIEGVVIPSRVANRRSTFDEIMESATAFNFRTRMLRIVNCRASGNSALGASGAGGFLYAVRSAEAGPGGILGGGEGMWVDIEGARTAIGANKSEHTNAAMRKRGNIVIELSGTVVGGTVEPQDRVWIGPEIAAGAIAQSLPAMPPATARAVVVTLDTDAAHDREQLTWAGTGLVVGRLPTVTAVAPATATTAGGVALTITGTQFEPGMTALVAGAAVPVTFHSATELAVTSPAGPSGPADVTVISSSGARATLAAAVQLVAP